MWRRRRSLKANDKVRTGIPGFDELVDGGLPRGRVILLVGGPGTGKTIFCAQFLVKGVTEYDESGLFVSLDENKFHLYREMSKFGWDLAKLEASGKFAFVDASPIRHIPGEVKLGKLTIGKREFSMASLIDVVRRNVETTRAKRVAVDPVASLIFQYPELGERRTAILDLIEALVGTGATCVLTTELRASGLERSVQLEEYLAHGVVIMQTLQAGKGLLRAISVEKMRETLIDTQPRPYKIGKEGIEVYPRESIF